MAMVCEYCGKNMKGRRIRRFCDRTCQERFENSKVSGIKEHSETNTYTEPVKEMKFPTKKKKITYNK